MKNVAIVEQLEYFNIGQILESGQVFRFEKINDHTYILIAKGKCIKITQLPESTTLMIYNSTLGEFEEIWRPYFDIDTDYGHIARTLVQKDSHMANAVAFGKGIRL